MKLFTARRSLLVGALVAASLALAGCSTAATPTVTPTATSTPDTLTGTINVFAAASLTEVFATMATAFNAEHPNVKVVYDFAGSSALATQITGGAPVDVFAAASNATMKTVTDASLTDGAPTVFVTNTLEIAVPPANTAKVTGLADFANPDLAIVLCAAEVPCGAAAKTVLDKAGIAASVDSFEQDVKSVLTKIELDEADAGLVYKTDVLAAGDKVKGIEFPEASAAVTSYPIATMKASTNKDAADAFVAFVLSPAGAKIMAAAGFTTP